MAEHTECLKEIEDAFPERNLAYKENTKPIILPLGAREMAGVDTVRNNEDSVAREAFGNECIARVPGGRHQVIGHRQFLQYFRFEALARNWLSDAEPVLFLSQDSFLKKRMLLANIADDSG